MPCCPKGFAMRRRAFQLTCGAALATLSLSLPVAVAHAGDQWCESDPLIVVRTPGGALVPLYVTSEALGLENLPYVLLASITYVASPAGPGTHVQMEVMVPGSLLAPPFETRATVSTGLLKTGAILATASGYSQQLMKLQFKLDRA
jgi:hypothetical protein